MTAITNKNFFEVLRLKGQLANDINNQALDHELEAHAKIKEMFNIDRTKIEVYYQLELLIDEYRNILKKNVLKSIIYT